MAEVKCANCGGCVALEMEQDFVSCSFCGSTLYTGRASSFRELCFDFIITEKRADSLFSEAIAKTGVGNPRVLSRKKMLLPFLSGKREGREVTRAGFTPHPSFFEDFEIPSGSPLILPPEAKEWGNLVVPEEETFLYFEARSGEAPVVCHLPFYEFTFGIEGNPLKAYVDAVAGRTFFEPFPLPTTAGENRLLLGHFVAYFLLFTVISFFIKSVPAAFFVTLALVLVTTPFMSDHVMRRFR